MNTRKNTTFAYSPSNSSPRSPRSLAGLADAASEKITLLRLATKQAVVTPAGVEELTDFAIPFYSSAKSLQLLSWSMPLPRGAQNLPERGMLTGAQALCSRPTKSEAPQLHWFQPAQSDQPNGMLVLLVFRGFSQLDLHVPYAGDNAEGSSQAWIHGSTLTERARTTALAFVPAGGSLNFMEHRFFGESYFRLSEQAGSLSSVELPTPASWVRLLAA